MDEPRLDAIARQLVSSRRSLLQLVSGMVAGFLILLSAGGTQARCRRICHRRHGRRVCRRRCSPDRKGQVKHTRCRELRDTCSTKAGCCGGGSVRVTCDFIDPFKARGRCGPAFVGDRCCTTEGWECTNSCDCCGSMACINGTCSYSLPGQECENSAQCLEGVCETVRPKHDGSCLIPGNLPPPHLCCFAEGGGCENSCECCGTLTCQDSVCSSFGGG